MSLKNLTQLTSEIDATVRAQDSDALIKTTAPGLNALLRSLAAELAALPQETALTTARTTARKADLDSSGRVPSGQLPSYVDDVLEAAGFATLPQPGEAGKIYVALDTNATYRWAGTQYVEISKTPVLYATTGPNTDGAMTQKAVTDALGGIIDQAANKAVLVRADRSKVYYTGNGTAAAANADDAVVQAFAAAAPGDYVYITAPVNMPNAGYYSALCVINGGANVNLGGYPITAVNRQDCLGIGTSGAGIVYGYGSVLTAVGPGSYGLNVTPAATGASYQLLNVNCRATGPGSGVLVRAGSFYQEGRIEVQGYGYGVRIMGVGSFSHELVGDLIVTGTNGSGFSLESNARLKLRNGRLAMLTAKGVAGHLYNTATLELERCVVDLTAQPLGGGLACHAAMVQVILTDTTVVGGSLIALGSGATLTLRGTTTLPPDYDAAYLQTQGVTVVDQRPVRGVALRKATVLTFEQDAEYAPITEGTFTLDDRTKRIGAVVTAYLGPGAGQPEITGQFQSRDVYVPGKSLMYMFKVGANDHIQYTITPLD